MLAIKVLIANNKKAYKELPEDERKRLDLGLSKKVYKLVKGQKLCKAEQDGLAEGDESVAEEENPKFLYPW